MESSDSHYIAHGNTNWGGWGDAPDYHCQHDEDNQAAYVSYFDYDIGVGCCSMDGSSGYRPDCNAHPATYQEAEELCSAHGYRLCTLEEMLDLKTAAAGCSYDSVYNWVSDECDEAAVVHSGKCPPVCSLLLLYPL